MALEVKLAKFETAESTLSNLSLPEKHFFKSIIFRKNWIKPTGCTLVVNSPHCRSV